MPLIALIAFSKLPSSTVKKKSQASLPRRDVWERDDEPAVLLQVEHGPREVTRAVQASREVGRRHELELSTEVTSESLISSRHSN